MNSFINWVIVIVLLALLFWFIYRIIRAAIRFPKHSLIFIVVLICVGNLYDRHLEKTRHLRAMPDAFKVEKILYAKEDSWGFGPGGAETGIIVYELPEASAKQITQGGLNYLSSMYDEDKYPNIHNHYSDWNETPIVFNSEWTSPEPSDKERAGFGFAPKIKNYLFHYGYPIDVDSAIEEDVDHAVSETGNFYAYGRHGLIIVIPKKHRVVFTYHG